MSSASGKVTGHNDGDRIRKALPVEALLGWAYGEQMVHQAQRETLITKSKGGPLAAFSPLWGDGVTPIDSSANQGFRASGDAWAIHDLVRALEPVKVDCGQDLAAARYHALGQYRGADPPLGRAASADHSNQSWPTDGVLAINVPTLVMLHAMKGTRPALIGGDKLRLKPGETVWHPKRKTRDYAKGWYCHVTVKGDLPGDILAAAVTYEAWWRALDQLRRHLKANRLVMFSVTDAMPPPPKKPGRGLAG